MERIAVRTQIFLRLALVATGIALAACSGAGTPPAPVAAGRVAASGSGTKASAAAPGSETVWVDDDFGTLGTGGVTAYSVSPSATALTAIAGDAYNEARPNLNSVATGVNAPQALAFDANGNLWVANQLSNLVVALKPGAAGVAPTLVLPSGVTFLPGRSPSGIGFDASNDLWIGGTPSDAAIAWTYAAHSLAADLTPAALTTTVPPSVGGQSTDGNFPIGLVFDRQGHLWTEGSTTKAGGLPNGVQSYNVSGGNATLSTAIAAPDCIGLTSGPFTFDAAGDLWCIAPGADSDSSSVEEFSNPSGTMLASFPVPKPSNVDVSHDYAVYSIRFDPGGTLWVLAEGSSGTPQGFGVPAYAALIALGPKGQTLTTLPFPSSNDFYDDFIFQP